MIEGDDDHTYLTFTRVFWSFRATELDGSRFEAAAASSLWHESKQ
jgi:hypothetical protein